MNSCSDEAQILGKTLCQHDQDSNCGILPGQLDFWDLKKCEFEAKNTEHKNHLINKTGSILGFNYCLGQIHQTKKLLYVNNKAEVFVNSYFSHSYSC